MRNTHLENNLRAMVWRIMSELWRLRTWYISLPFLRGVYAGFFFYLKEQIVRNKNNMNNIKEN